MADHWHIKWLKEGVQKWNKRRQKVKFSPNLSGVKFFDLLPPDFRDAPKTSRYFENIDLSDAALAEADLSHLNFYKGNFQGADLSNADLTLSNFDRANFSRADLSGVEVQNSSFKGAKFEISNLQGVNFREVDATGAIFIESQISEDQIAVLGSEKIQVFPSRADHNDFLAAYESPARPRVARPPKREDDRTRKYKYDVFFGTNRRPIIERGALTGFDGRHSSELSFGVCEVIVPEGRTIGSLGSPLWKRLLNRSDDRLRIGNLIALNESLFFEYVRTGAGKMSRRQKPTIFVHGFNNTFENAVRRAAQIGYDLGIGQGVGLFSWPSKGQRLRYKTDEAAVEASKYHLADFIEKFVTLTDQDGVNLIAHSMGCRCLLGALEVLSIDRKAVLAAIDQVIMAAADVDSAIMPRLGVPAISSSNRATSYISDQDKALKLSGWLHSFPRIGVTPPTFVMNGLDTILVNGLDLGDAKHSYVGTSRAVLNDIYALLKDGSSPSDRFAVERVSGIESPYWRIKD